MTKPSLKIIVAFHKPYEILQQYQLYPDQYIFCLCGNNKIDIDSSKYKIVRDCLGENISFLNPMFSEMTAVYWMWKHYNELGNLDFIGLNHYRRAFNQNQINDYQEYDLIHYNDIFLYKHIQQRYINTRDLFYKNIKNVDINIWLNFIQKQNTNESKIIIDCFNKPCFYTKNMFIMKRQLFMTYCNWIFEKLFIAQNLIPKPTRLRFVSYVAEFLTNVFFIMHQNKVKIKMIDIPIQYI